MFLAQSALRVDLRRSPWMRPTKPSMPPPAVFANCMQHSRLETWAKATAPVPASSCQVEKLAGNCLQKVTFEQAAAP